MSSFLVYLLFVTYWACLIAALLFVSRLVASLFSEKVREQMCRHPVIHSIWGFLALVGVLLYYGGLYPELWPPHFFERRGQRATVAERIQSAGGWAALQKDCDELAEGCRTNTFYWHRGWDTNALPRSISALNPQEVRCYSPKVVRNSEDDPQIPVVHIKVFGIHSTGGHSIPYFGLEIACGTNAVGYRPKPAHGGVSGNHYDSYTRVTDRIYEIY